MSFMHVNGWEPHLLKGRCKGARENKAANARLQARDVHDLQEVTLHRAKQQGVAAAGM